MSACHERFIPISFPAWYPTEVEAAHRTIEDMLSREVGRVEEYYEHVRLGEGAHLYTGLGGLAYMHYALSFPDKGDRLLSLILRAVPLKACKSRFSFLETQLGVATLALARSPHTDSRTIVAKSAVAATIISQAIEDVTSVAVLHDHEDAGSLSEGCEVLYGRVGLLYALLYLRKAYDALEAEQKRTWSYDHLISDETILRVVDEIIERGQVGAAQMKEACPSREVILNPPLMWTWHGKRYLGGAHGAAGILQMLLCCPPHLLAKHGRLLWDLTLWFVDIQDDEGNWPSSIRHPSHPTQESNKLVQWCHGAPGIIIPLAKAIKVFQTEPMIRHAHNVIPDIARIKVALGKAADITYRQGLLRKGVGLCHGVSGNVFALLAAADVLDDRDGNEKRALHLASLATQWEVYTHSGEMRLPDAPWSLYEGLSGMCCAWKAVLDRREKRVGMPGYDDL